MDPMGVNIIAKIIELDTSLEKLRNVTPFFAKHQSLSWEASLQGMTFKGLLWIKRSWPWTFSRSWVTTHKVQRNNQKHGQTSNFQVKSMRISPINCCQFHYPKRVNFTNYSDSSGLPVIWPRFDAHGETPRHRRIAWCCFLSNKNPWWKMKGQKMSACLL